ncbi:MAG: hypothetical protein MUF87_08695 [Anaerolineae bacterium]|nr:hypothetical protein [Anaerolineae bacterium]
MIMDLGNRSASGFIAIYGEDLVKHSNMFRLRLRYFKERFYQRPQEKIVGLFFAP